MKSYFYQAPKLMKGWLETQYNSVRKEDQYFRDAILAALKLDPSRGETLAAANELREAVLDMTIEQQFRYANNVHLESLYNHFYALHRASRGRNMIIKGQEAISKDIVDPDKFPIWDLKPAPNVFYSTWASVIGRLRYDLGHQLIVRQSLVEHPQGGKGVFAVLPASKKVIRPGDFLGVVPGTIYDSESSYRELKLNKLTVYERTPHHLHFPTGKVLELGHITHNTIGKDMQRDQSVTKIEPSLKNPYALGHMVNHPPSPKQANIVFSEIELAQNFIPRFLYQKYLPYDNFQASSTKKVKNVSIFGMFASKEIRHGQELYVDYCENHIYPIERIPDWLIEPTERQQNVQTPEGVLIGLRKGEYEHPSPAFWDWVEKQALEKNKQLYEKYKKQITSRPREVIYEDDDIRVRPMK